MGNEKLQLSQYYQDHEKVVRRLNKVKKSWVAGTHEQFEGMNLLQLNERAGRKKYFSYLQMKENDDDKYKDYSQSDVSDLPRAFDYS